MKYSGIGGEAVIEGIMMRNKDDYAVAVRKSDGEIAVQKERYVSEMEKHPICRVPFIRGIFAFADSMILGMRALNISADYFDTEEEDEEPSRFEKLLDKLFGEKVEQVLMAGVMVFSILAAIGIFMLLPVALANLLRPFVQSETLMALIEGVIRIGIFVGYIKLITLMDDIKRTFMYHGAEHKCINCIEHGMPLTVDNVRVSSRLHKRCGTSFIIFVMIISILLFMVIRVPNIWLRFLSRIVLIPVIAGISYEILSYAGKSDSPIVNFLSRPGFWMQGLTTREPDDSMIEVAIVAVNTVFDWRAYLGENFPETVIPEDLKDPQANEIVDDADDVEDVAV